MRRIVAILIVLFVVVNTVFWILYGVFEPWRVLVNGLVFNVVGPTIYKTISGFVSWIIATVGIAGFAVIVGIPVFILGILAHHYWVKGDWWLRRWGQSRTARDLGTAPVTSMPSTPVGATTRPVATIPLPPAETVVVPPPEEKPKEAET